MRPKSLVIKPDRIYPPPPVTMVLCTIIKKLYFGFSEKVRLVYLGFALSEKIRLLFFRFGLLAIAGNVAPQVLVLIIAPNFWPGPRAGPGRQNFESCTGRAGLKFKCAKKSLVIKQDMIYPLPPRHNGFVYNCQKIIFRLFRKS